MELDKTLKDRHCVRKFSSKKPNWRKIIEAIDAARYSPVAGGNYTLKFILVSDGEKIQKIAQAAQQDFIAQASYLVVVCSNPERLVNSYEERGNMYARQQAGAAIENFFLKITELGLATCWVGAFVESQIKEILDIPGKIEVEALFPIGYEYSKSQTRKRKIDLDNILRFENYNNKRMKTLPKKQDV